jgi:hypothetical protein
MARTIRPAIPTFVKNPYTTKEQAITAVKAILAQNETIDQEGMYFSLVSHIAPNKYEGLSYYVFSDTVKVAQGFTESSLDVVYDMDKILDDNKVLTDKGYSSSKIESLLQNIPQSGEVTKVTEFLGFLVDFSNPTLGTATEFSGLSATGGYAASESEKFLVPFNAVAEIVVSNTVNVASDTEYSDLIYSASSNDIALFRKSMKINESKREYVIVKENEELSVFTEYYGSQSISVKFYPIVESLDDKEVVSEGISEERVIELITEHTQAPTIDEARILELIKNNIPSSTGGVSEERIIELIRENLPENMPSSDGGISEERVLELIRENATASAGDSSVIRDDKPSMITTYSSTKIEEQLKILSDAITNLNIVELGLVDLSDYAQKNTLHDYVQRDELDSYVKKDEELGD